MQTTKILTDESLMELVTHGSSAFPFQYYYEDVGKFENRCIDWHWHREFELVSVTQGILQCSVGNINYILEPGDGIFINSGMIHRFVSAGTAVIPNVLFASDFIAPENSSIHEKYMLPFLTSGISHYVLKKNSPWQKDVLSCLSNLYCLCENQGPAWEMEAHILACQVWKNLFEHKQEFPTMENTGISKISQARLKGMTRFIEENYWKKITLEDIAASVGVSKREALRCFQCSIPLSPMEYLNKFRLQKAWKLLIHTDCSITDIAGQIGLESTSYFDRLFKREFHITPRKHRNSAKKS